MDSKYDLALRYPIETGLIYLFSRQVCPVMMKAPTYVALISAECKGGSRFDESLGKISIGGIEREQIPRIFHASLCHVSALFCQ